jgi:hypothetical protein
MNETIRPKEVRKINKIKPNITDGIAEILFITLCLFNNHLNHPVIVYDTTN